MKPDYEFQFMTCAICGEPVDLSRWYAVILDSKVHHPCFQRAKAQGFDIELKPNCIVNNLKTNTANGKLSDPSDGPASGAARLPPSQVKVHDIAGRATRLRVA